MSVIALLLGWTKLPAWVQELIVIAGLLLMLFIGVKLWDHHIYEQGIAAQQAIDQKNSAADKAVLEARATTAEQNYEKSQTDLDTFRNANPIGAVRLCVPPGTHLQTRPLVANGGSPVAPAAGVQQVPAGDSGSGAATAGPDISGMLDLLAARADEVDAQAIELQAAH